MSVYAWTGQAYEYVQSIFGGILNQWFAKGGCPNLQLESVSEARLKSEEEHLKRRKG